MTARLSQAEVLQTGLKAARGAGLPHGLDLDAAANVTWLAACGIDGVSLLAGELGEEFRTMPGRLHEMENGILQLCTGRQSGLVLAPAAIDLALLGQSVRVPGCRAAALVVAEAARRASASRTLAVRWSGERGAEEIICVGDGSALGPLDRLPAVATVIVTPPGEDGCRTGPRFSPSTGSLAVDPAAWAVIAGAAARTLVESSCRSRSGAGAEVDDSE